MIGQYGGQRVWREVKKVGREGLRESPKDNESVMVTSGQVSLQLLSEPVMAS